MGGQHSQKVATKKPGLMFRKDAFAVAMAPLEDKTKIKRLV